MFWLSGVFRHSVVSKCMFCILSIKKKSLYKLFNSDESDDDWSLQSYPITQFFLVSHLQLLTKLVYFYHNKNINCTSLWKYALKKFVHIVI